MNTELKNTFRGILYRSRLIQITIGVIKRIFRNESVYRFSHLTILPSNRMQGALQKDDALLLYGLVKMIRPKLVVEFGFGKGYSSLNFLNAIDRDARVVSFDILESCEQIARKSMPHTGRYKFIGKSALEITASDLGYEKADLVYWDAIYDPVINLQVFEVLKPLLSENAILALHDTGAWQKKYMGTSHFTYAEAHKDSWLNEEMFQQQKGQRKFVNVLMEKYPEYQVIHLHSERYLRCGMTLLQKRKNLPTEYQNRQ
jgi:predicted O-methyltransferase YrrM